MNRTNGCRRCGGEGHAAPLLECPMRDDLWEALREWAGVKGFRWKGKLAIAWANGIDVGEALEEVRRIVGTVGLISIDLGAERGASCH